MTPLKTKRNKKEPQAKIDSTSGSILFSYLPLFSVPEFSYMVLTDLTYLKSVLLSYLRFFLDTFKAKQWNSLDLTTVVQIHENQQAVNKIWGDQQKSKKK